MRGAQNAWYTVVGGRTGILLQNLDTADAISCGFDTGVSTATANSQIGFTLNYSDVAYIGAMPQLAVYCMAVDAAGAAGVRVHLTQFGR